MNRISRSELLSLTQPGEGPRVTMYVPLERAYPGSRGNPLRLRQARESAQAQLTDSGMTAHLADVFLEPVTALEGRDEFWRGTDADTLAVLRSPDVMQSYHLPYDCPDSVDVGPRFYVSPLVSLLDWPVAFFLLALGGESVRLFRGTREGLTPQLLDQQTSRALAEHEAATLVIPSSRSHSGAARSPTGATIPLVHGGTSYKDQIKDQRIEYVQIVVNDMEQIARREPLPIVLLGVDAMQAVFRGAYQGPGLLDEGIEGSPERFNERDMCARVVEIVEKHHRDQRIAAYRRYANHATNASAIADLERIIPFAHEGRVDVLLAVQGKRIWGTWDPQTSQVQRNEAAGNGRVDLLDLAVVETLTHAGTVHMFPRKEMPDDRSAVALLRW